jgi:hypothetical protein
MTENERDLGRRWFEEVWNKGRRDAIAEMLRQMVFFTTETSIPFDSGASTPPDSSRPSKLVNFASGHPPDHPARGRGGRRDVMGGKRPAQQPDF